MKHRHTPHSGLRWAAAVGLTITAASTAWGQERQEGHEPEPIGEQSACMAAFHEAQLQKAEARYQAARRELLKCAQTECGDAMIASCIQMYAGLESAIPSVVPSAKRGGAELANVSVDVNGTPVSGHLEGTPLELDPGVYTFTFHAPGLPSVQHEVVLRAGEQRRPLVAVFPAEAPVPAFAPATVGSRPTPALQPASRGVPVMSYVLGGLGLAGLGTFVAYRVSAANLEDELDQVCAPRCSRSATDGVDQRYLMSNIALGVGAAAIAGAVLVYTLTPEHPAAPEIAVMLSPLGDGASARATLDF